VTTIGVSQRFLPVPTKKQIINAIVKVARQLGHTPSILEFAARAEISRYLLFRRFPKWNDAVRAAGLRPNRLHVRPEDSELLKDWGETVRKKRAMPSRWAYRLAGKYYPLTLAKRFGGWESVPQAFRNFAKAKREWRDVLALLHNPVAGANAVPSGASLPGSILRSPLATRLPRASRSHSPLYSFTYGNPLDFRGLRYEPVNEQGVVLLFGMLAKDLGYLIEAVQKGFPDCEAMRQVAPERWQRVNIEFEFESKNFRDHGHPIPATE
jgi:hypothetical protein